MIDHRLPRRALLAAGLAGASGLPGLARAQTSSAAKPRTTYGDTGQPDPYPPSPSYPTPTRPRTPYPAAPSSAYPRAAAAPADRTDDGYVAQRPLTQPTSPLPYGRPDDRPDERYVAPSYEDDRPAQRFQGTEGPPTPDFHPNYPASTRAETYSRNEIVQGASDFLGVTAEAVGSAVERLFRDNGRPTAYIAGEEGSGAFIAGLRYGKGLLYMKRRRPETVYWQGPTVGWDFGGNGSRSFTLCYNLQYPDAIYRRFPGVEGTAYFIGGLGVNYQRADDITLAPMRAGLGLRLGANVGYLAYSRRRNWFPF